MGLKGEAEKGGKPERRWDRESSFPAKAANSWSLEGSEGGWVQDGRSLALGNEVAPVQPESRLDQAGQSLRADDGRTLGCNCAQGAC